MQKEGVIKPAIDTSGTLYFDPLGIKTFADLTANMVKKVSIPIRKKGLENFLANNIHKAFTYKTASDKKINIWVMAGANYDATEFHIAEKLARAGQHIIFPNQGDLGAGRKNDVYLYDSKTFIQRKVELKVLLGETAETVKKQLISGSGQASVVAYDIQSGIKKNWLIEGLRSGWSDDLKVILLNYKGQWYQLDKKNLFSETIYRIVR